MNVVKDNTVCRVCISEIGNAEQSYYLFEKIEDTLGLETKFDILISDKIEAIAKVDIKVDDGLPKVICSSCFLELEEAYTFKRKCERSDDILRIAVGSYESSNQIQDIICKEEIDNEFTDQYSDDETIPLSELHLSENLKPVSDDDETNEDIKPDINTFGPTGEDVIEPEDVYLNNKNITEKKSKAIDLKLECHDCGNLFKSKCKLKVHWKKEHDKYTCPHCKRIFKSCKPFLNHKKNPPVSCRKASKFHIEGEGKSKVFRCKECDFSTKSTHTIVNHLVVHSEDLPFSCDQCPRAFSRPFILKLHKERAHKKYLGQRACHVCGDIILGKSKYWEHVKKHSKTNDSCKVCKKVMRVGSMANHMKRHSGVKAYACEKCAATFYTAGELNIHLIRHAGTKKTFICKVCGFKLHDKYIMAKHERKHKHDNVACTICGTFVDNVTQLSLHQQRHLNKKQECEYCDKKFFKRKYLLNHWRMIHKIYISAELRSEIDKTVKNRKKKNK